MFALFVVSYISWMSSQKPMRVYLPSGTPVSIHRVHITISTSIVDGTHRYK